MTLNLNVKFLLLSISNVKFVVLSFNVRIYPNTTALYLIKEKHLTEMEVALLQLIHTNTIHFETPVPEYIIIKNRYRIKM